MLRRTYFDTPIEKGCFDLVWSLNWIGGMACLKFWGPKILWRRFFHQPYKGWDQTNSKRYNSQQQDCISHHWADTSPITTIVILTWFGVAMKKYMVWSGNSTSRSISHQFAAFSQLFRTFFFGCFFWRWVFFLVSLHTKHGPAAKQAGGAMCICQRPLEADPVHLQGVSCKRAWADIYLCLYI